MPDPQGKPSPAPAGSAVAERSKRNKRDSRKKREAKGLEPDGAPPKKKAAVSANIARPSTALSILRPILVTDPRPSDVYPPQPRQMNYAFTKTSDVLKQSWEFYEVVDKLTNKNGFRYSYAIADPLFEHIKYRQTDLAPYHARFSFEDSPAAIAFSKDGRAVSTNEPWHSARANVCAREGKYYYEARIISGIVNAEQASNPPSSRGHVRLGWARREAELDVNVGVDSYGYGLRDVNGEAVHRMRCEYFFPKGESIREGDVVGLLITLPPLSLHRKIVEGTYDPAVDGPRETTDGDQNHQTSPAQQQQQQPFITNIIRDRIPFHLKNDFCWQQSNVFPTKALRDYAFNLKEPPTISTPSPTNQEDPSLRTLPGSSITVYRNGQKMGTPFRDLLAFLPPASRLGNGTNHLGIGERENADDGMIGYFPTVSCYGGGAVECRFEGPWWYGTPSDIDDVRPIGERYVEQIVEDVVADIVDEVEAMFLFSEEAKEENAPGPTPAPAANGAAASNGTPADETAMAVDAPLGTAAAPSTATPSPAPTTPAPAATTTASATAAPLPARAPATTAEVTQGPSAQTENPTQETQTQQDGDVTMTGTGN
ncbi:hypothetical protein VTN31DRAFT_628 [Thermomyces dupontii]|uniref:uncharacterized protein n=1 Tax=Talaromyces thermophilus TaxID=28565 RepID=UPI003742877A